MMAALSNTSRDKSKFDEWLEKHNLIDEKQIFIEHNMDKLSDLSLQNENLGPLLADKRLCNKVMTVFAVIQSLDKQKMSEKKDIIISHKENEIMEQLQQHVNELKQLQNKAKQIHDTFNNKVNSNNNTLKQYKTKCSRELTVITNHVMKYMNQLKELVKHRETYLYQEIGANHTELTQQKSRDIKVVKQIDKAIEEILNEYSTTIKEAIQHCKSQTIESENIMKTYSQDDIFSHNPQREKKIIHIAENTQKHFTDTKEKMVNYKKIIEQKHSKKSEMISNYSLESSHEDEKKSYQDTNFIYPYVNVIHINQSLYEDIKNDINTLISITVHSKYENKNSEKAIVSTQKLKKHLQSEKTITDQLQLQFTRINEMNKEGKKKAKKGDALAAFKANIMAQQKQQKTEQKTVDLDAYLDDMNKDDDNLTKHGRTTTSTILAQLSQLTDDDDDMKSPDDEEEEVEHDDNSEFTFLHNLNDYLAKDFATHKRSWSNISNSSSKSSHGDRHARSGTLFSLSHTRTRKESMQLILNVAKIEKKARTEEYQLFNGILDENIEKLEKFVKKNIDLHLLWSFLDIILFKTVKYYQREDINMDIKDIYGNIFKVFSKKKFLKNGCFRQYIKFLSSSNSGNPISLLMDNLLLFENDKKINYNSRKDKLIMAWEYIANKGYKNVDEIDVNSKDFDFYDPIRCDFDFKNCFIRKVIIRKVFNSANKPLLLEIHCADDSMNSVVLKKGDDLRKDKALMNIFKFMNYIWLKESKTKGSQFNLKYKKTLVKILTFNVVAITNKVGIIELVPNCIPLRHINRYLDELIDEHLINLLSSAAASYIGSFVCGVKDRHFDNILVRTTDATLFHIDFGYCLGESIKNPLAIDTGIFAITEEFYNIIGKENYEQYFVPLCVDTFLCLRKHFKELIEFTLLSFSYLFKEKQIKKVEDFLMKKLKVYEKNEGKIKEWLSSKILKAPFSKKTKLKNKLHRMNAPTLTEKDLDKVESK